MKGIPLGHPQIKVVSHIPAVLSVPFTRESNVVAMHRNDMKGDFEGLADTIFQNRKKFDPATILTDGILKPVNIEFLREPDYLKKCLLDITDGARREGERQALDRVFSDMEEILVAAQALPRFYSVEFNLRSRANYDLPTEKLQFLESGIGWWLSRWGLLKGSPAGSLHFDGKRKEELFPGDPVPRLVLASYGDDTTAGALNENIIVNWRGNPYLKRGKEKIYFGLGDVWSHALLNDEPETMAFPHSGTTTDRSQLIMIAEVFCRPG